MLGSAQGSAPSRRPLATSRGGRRSASTTFPAYVGNTCVRTVRTGGNDALQTRGIRPLDIRACHPSSDGNTRDVAGPMSVRPRLSYIRGALDTC